MKIIRYSDLAVVPWKNGAGVRREVISEEHRAGENEQPQSSWSVGLADLNQDAPFSAYPSINRWFMPLGEGRLALVFKEGAQDRAVEMNGSSEALRFSGGDEVHMLLHDGPMKALNVMTTTEELEVSMERVQLRPHGSVQMASSPASLLSLMVLVSAQCGVTAQADSLELRSLDSLVFATNQSMPTAVLVDSLSDWIVIRISKKSN